MLNVKYQKYEANRSSVSLIKDKISEKKNPQIYKYENKKGINASKKF